MGFVRHCRGGVVYSSAAELETPHAFLTRLGGVSRGIYSSLNLSMSAGDDPAMVRENYRRVAAALSLPSDRFVFSKQVHRTDIRLVSPADCIAPYDPIGYEADGLITDIPSLPLIIFTADCIPVLLSDPVSRCVGAVHAGWRGTVENIAGLAAAKMASAFGARPENIRAAIGPGIGLCCFETGAEVPDAVRRLLGAEAEPYITCINGRPHVDLKGVNRAVLLRAGLRPEHIFTSPECTMCLPGDYWSHRYTQGRRGVQGSLIMLKGTMEH